MKMSGRTALPQLLLLLVLLFFGTQMPGSWREAVFQFTHLPSQVSELGHFVWFAALASTARRPPMHWSVLQVTQGALALALLTEGLQIVALGRNASWVDVGIDMLGAAMGLMVSVLQARFGKGIIKLTP
jgi:VanZ family protein